jgi:hypothetical protein
MEVKQLCERISCLRKRNKGSHDQSTCVFLRAVLYLFVTLDQDGTGVVFWISIVVYLANEAIVIDRCHAPKKATK